MRLLFVRDVVGHSGRAIVVELLPRLIADWKLDCVVVNGENAAGGFGITEPIYQDLIDAGADAITLGNPAWDQREGLVFTARGTPVIPAKNGARVLIVNAMGRVFMDPLDDPFATVDRELHACPLGSGADAVIIHIPAEAAARKQ